MTDILAKIETYKREEIAAAKRARPLDALERDAKSASPPRGFVRAIEQRIGLVTTRSLPRSRKPAPRRD